MMVMENSKNRGTEEPEGVLIETDVHVWGNSAKSARIVKETQRRGADFLAGEARNRLRDRD
jgi:hypothetical protein